MSVRVGALLSAVVVLVVAGQPAVTAEARASSTTPKPVIVLDPGHSRTVHATYRGLDVSDYANQPEMRDVWDVAELVRARLRHDGYRVVMTKNRVGQRASLAHRALVANRAHAALAVSIHDQAGAKGGIRFHRGNNIVYRQSVGGYRTTRGGTKIRFTDKHVAALSARYGRAFRVERARHEHHSVTLKRNVGYNLGSRGLAPGNMWMVQLLSRVPWIYNEAGGNSAGRVGLSAKDKHRYAYGLIASIERCVPIHR